MKTPTSFDDFFKAATDNPPYGWQRRLAEDPECQSRLIDIPTGLGKTAGVVLAWLWNRVGKEEGKRENEQGINLTGEWPRRLVYCLPMRTLVEQTEQAVQKWLRNLWKQRSELNLSESGLQELAWMIGADENANLSTFSILHSSFRSPVLLMGGEDLDPAKKEWDIYPEKPAILIGTQDMLLSRALNRGYGMSRYRWPMHFALLNNDALWVMDEVQLMGAGIQTARQLEAFRRSDDVSDKPRGMTLHGTSFTWYCSATASETVLTTREWRGVTFDENWKIELSNPEKSTTEGEVARRRLSTKKLRLERSAQLIEKIDTVLSDHKNLVSTLDKHQATGEIPRRTLVICNTVDRAKDLHEKLTIAIADDDRNSQPELVLLHSRFRPPERKTTAAKLKSDHLQSLPHGQIVVSTQVIEAGVDISSGIIWTEIAPLSTLVQRMGRINRAGEFGHNGTANCEWKPTVDILGVGVKDAPAKEKKEDKEKRERENHKRCLPYKFEACEAAWQALKQLNGDASPANLSTIKTEIADSIQSLPYSLLRHELLDFFDTDANLSLGFTDVSPFVRGLDEDTDVYVLWRQWEKQTEPSEHYRGDIGRNEICSVPISKINDFKNRNKGFLWLGKERGWVSAAKVAPFPGCIFLLPCDVGGYSEILGWTGLEPDRPSDLYQPAELPSDEDMLSILKSCWQSIDEHTQDVKREWAAIANALLPSMDLEKQVGDEAVIWHDFGKHHPRWQQAVTDACEEAQIIACEEKRPWGKFDLTESPKLKNPEGQPITGKALQIAIIQIKRLFRPGVMHEVASALALRQFHISKNGAERNWDETNQAHYLRHLLSEYLVMTHHGRVRKVLRDEIPKKTKSTKAIDTIRGIKKGDRIPSVRVCNVDLPETTLDIECRKMGRTAHGHESYTKGVLRLLDHYGPFRLAFLEALFRAADIRASKLASEAKTNQHDVYETRKCHQHLATAASRGEAAEALAADPSGCDEEHGLREGTGGHRDDSRTTRPDRATRYVETTRGVLSYSELAPILAERVARTEAEIFKGLLAEKPILEDVFLDLHSRICGDLTPEWAGRWRAVDVAVGNLEPPPPYQVPLDMRNYCLDLQARCKNTSDLPLLLELLAFAEGRFLTIHPFRDFNGRTIRLFLTELLRRLDLPPVDLAPEAENSRLAYFRALEAADQNNLQPLMAIWQERLESTSETEDSQ